MEFTRTLALAAMVVALAGGVSSAQLSLTPGDEDPVVSLQARPELALDSDSLELGTISDDAKVTKKMGFKNKGNGTLKIVGLRGSCGCTVPQLTKTEYGPGEGGEIEVTFDPHHKNGPIRNTVTITSNDVVRPTREFYLVGTVNPIVQIEPQMVNFGQLRKGTEKKQEVTITARLPVFEVTAALSGDPKLVGVKVLGNEKVSDGVYRARLEFTVPATAPVGSLSQTATIRTNDDARVLTIGTFGQIMGDLAVQPMSVSFGMIQVNADVNQTINVVNSTMTPFKMTGAKYVPVANAGTFTPEVTIAPQNDGKSYVVQVKGKAPEASVPIQGEIQITTDVPGEELIKVPVFGSVVTTVPTAGMGKGSPTGAPLPPNMPAGMYPKTLPGADQIKKPQ